MPKPNYIKLKNEQLIALADEGKITEIGNAMYRAKSGYCARWWINILKEIVTEITEQEPRIKKGAKGGNATASISVNDYQRRLLKIHILKSDEIEKEIKDRLYSKWQKSHKRI